MNKIDKIVKILSFMEQENLLNDKELRKIVTLIIRNANEPNSNWHSSADCRSSRAEAEIVKLSRGKKLSKTVYQKVCSKHLRHEHIVPITVVYDMLCNPQKTATLPGFEDAKGSEQIRQILIKYTKRATISKDESKKIDKSYRHKMPESFWVSGDAYSRYKETGIYKNLMFLEDNQKWD